ncbi:MAG: hypothetical protein VZS44_11455 [Bacilli bacterium]|nr:hypothetical protein [Bacilli bacterium]
MRIKRWVKVLAITLVVISLFKVLDKSNKDFMEKCTNKGYSVNYCELHK